MKNLIDTMTAAFEDARINPRWYTDLPELTEEQVTKTMEWLQDLHDVEFTEWMKITRMVPAQAWDYYKGLPESTREELREVRMRRVAAKALKKKFNTTRPPWM